MPTKKIKVLLADDHTIVIDGLVALLPQHDIDVVGAVEVASDILPSFERLAPDVLILDIRFGERRSGLETGKELLHKHPAAKVIFLSQFDQDGIIREVYEIGGLAYLTKNCRSDELIAAIRSAALGTTYFLPDITKRLLNISKDKNSASGSTLNSLNERELKVFVLMAQGLTNIEMAAKLDVSPKLISNISHAIKGKLDITRRADFTRLAIDQGYIEP